MARPAIQPAAVVTSVMLTQSDSLEKPASPVRAPARAHRRWALPLAALGTLTVFTPVVAALVPAEWFVDKTRCAAYGDEDADGDGLRDCVEFVVEPIAYAQVPASAEPVAPRLSVSGAPTFEPSGDIFFVTVRAPAVQVLDWFITRDDPAARFLSELEKNPTGDPEERLRQGQRQMTGAKEWATFVALTVAGYDAELVNGAALVDYALCIEANEEQTECLVGTPAYYFLKDLDHIVEVDGQPVAVLDDLSAIVGAHEPGDVVEVVVERADGNEFERVTGEVELIASPDDPERTILGFMPVDTRTLEIPEGMVVDFDTGSIGGPSAGLAFTLALIDDLTEGELTGGQQVAVTGTIQLDGSVGAIGGLHAKASAVMQMGVKYFLVPASQPETGPDSVAAAREVVGDAVQIIPVATLEEALAVLAELGGDALPPPAETATTDA